MRESCETPSAELAITQAREIEVFMRTFAELAGESIDMGNLYRVLRALEEESLVRSEWHGEGSGPARRSYELTDAGRTLLDSWAVSLGETERRIGAFLERYEQGKEVN